MNAVVSIIIPVYNSEKYLDKCIISVLNQTFTDFQLILIDDGSTDSSVMICDKYAQMDSRVNVKHIRNGGVSNARNIGIDTACGRYISFIDSDDYIEEDYIKYLYSSLIDNSAQLVLCPIRAIDDKYNRELKVKSGVTYFDNIDKQLFLDLNEQYLLYGPTNKLYLREIIEKNNLRFDTTISYGEDLIFNFTYYKYINKISITDKVSYFYVQDNAKSLSKKYYENKFDIAKKIHFTLLDFFKHINFIDKQSYGLLYGRLFDDVYNSLFLINHSKFRKGIINKFNYVKFILEDNELNKCMDYADTSIYSKKIVSIIKYRSAILFLAFNYFARLSYKLKGWF